MYQKPICILSIDVEDWFHLIGAGLDYQFRMKLGGPEIWDRLPGRVVVNTHWILDLLDRYHVKATFFILGWVAERYPDLVQEIHRRGHEIASHSYWHKVVKAQKPAEFRSDLQRSIDVLQRIIGSRVLGFRASTASITDWAIDILAEEGLLYDSSLFPAFYHDVYGKIQGTEDRKPIEQLRNGLWEIKFSTLQIGKQRLPWSGGGYFRLLPYWIFQRGVRRLLAQSGMFMFYLHSWEVDADPPRLPNLRPMYYFRRYVSIRKVRSRFERLLSDFNFVSIRQALKDLGYEFNIFENLKC
jgi:polysaccharide deacetylase family protein (PEP-CTERM system associated)